MLREANVLENMSPSSLWFRIIQSKNPAEAGNKLGLLFDPEAGAIYVCIRLSRTHLKDDVLTKTDTRMDNENNQKEKDS
jgi:hypothetical protein